VRAYNDHNVYILGAGFSAEAGLPVIKDFMNRMRDAAAWLEGQAGRQRELEAISRVLEFRLRAAAAASRVPLNVENIEELFSLASATDDQELAAAMPLAIAATLDYAWEVAMPSPDWQRFQIGIVNQPEWNRPLAWTEPLPYVQEGMKRGDRKGSWYSCSPYDFYLGVMAGYFNKGGPDRQDTIITFNYDMIVDDALRNLGMRVNYGLIPSVNRVWPEGTDWVIPQPPDGVRLLKLHGSVSWSAWGEEEELAAIDAGIGEAAAGVGVKEARDHVRVYRGSVKRTVITADNYRALQTKGRPPLLIPPTWRKTFTDRLAGVWDAAVVALRTATNIIILGYSAPSTDQHFRYLIAAGLQDNISLRKIFFVNPALADETQAAVLKDRLFGSGGLFRPELQEQGIVELLPVDTREFFTGPHDINAGEPYRVRIGRPLNPRTCTADDAPFRFSDRVENLGAWW